MHLNRRFVLGVVLLTLAALSVSFAQSYRQVVPPLWDTGFQSATGGAGNKRKITLRVWHERTQHTDGTSTWFVNYRVDSYDKNWLGNWNSSAQLFQLTYSIKIVYGNGTSVTKNGTRSLSSLYSSEGVLEDGAGCDPGNPPIATVTTVTASRFGGSSGISVTCTH